MSAVTRHLKYTIFVRTGETSLTSDYQQLSHIQDLNNVSKQALTLTHTHTNHDLPLSSNSSTLSQKNYD